MIQKKITEVRLNRPSPKLEWVSVEEPLEVRVRSAHMKSTSIGITMRTPGQDKMLVVGMMYNSGIIDSIGDIRCISSIEDRVIEVHLADHISMNSRMGWGNITTSSCGLCGKETLEALEFHSSYSPWNSKAQIDIDVIYQLPIDLRESQSEFQFTGGLHCAALFDFDGKLMGGYEDIGRHNALDKLTGFFLDSRAEPSIVVVSGRLSFELVMKGVKIGAPIMVAIGPPSTLAIELAEQEGMTLIGFLSDQKFNCYSHDYRIKKGLEV